MFSTLFALSRQAHLQLVSVDLGLKKISLPVIDIQGKIPGKTLVVTAGMDGDEYAGIQAAYHLVEKFRSRDFSGRLVILPIMNIPGFEAECSQNPFDGKFPKNIFPGNSTGSPTERLIAWLNATYLSKAYLWHDMHSGALTEGLNPFVWTYETGVNEIDQRIHHLHRFLSSGPILFQTASRSSKYTQLARQGCAYLMAESGERGYARSADVERHIDWVISSMTSLGMLPPQRRPSKTAPKLFRHISFVLAPRDGLWSLKDFSRKQITSGAVLGSYREMHEIKLHAVKAPSTGFPLWWKETLRMKKGEVVCAIAQE